MQLCVAPLAGARIEMIEEVNASNLSCVAPLAGARIEIAVRTLSPLCSSASLPSRERGLKFL